jgi:hypothetical protein
MSWKGYAINWLLVKIIKNLRISIQSVHVRYEDEYSHPEVTSDPRPRIFPNDHARGLD